MKIIVYGKAGCARCEKAKEKLRDVFGLAFEARDLEALASALDGWRTDGTIAARAEWSRVNLAVPLILIDGVGHDYAGAMRTLKRARKGNA